MNPRGTLKENFNGGELIGGGIEEIDAESGAEGCEVDLSIIIVNWNTKDFLKQCLQSIMEQASRYRTEVIVVDNASFD